MLMADKKAEGVVSTSLYKKLLEVKKSVSYLQKTAKGGQYNYTSSSQVLSAVREKMNEQGLILTAHVNGCKVTVHEETVPKPRITYFTELDMVFTWIDTETGQQLALGWYGQGVDIAGEKGVGKAMTYAEKYFILKQFNIPTDKDDPDAFQDKNQTEENIAAKAADTVAKLVAKVKECKDRESVTAIWKANVDFQTNSDFKAAVIKMGEKYNVKKEAPKENPDAGKTTE